MRICVEGAHVNSAVPELVQQRSLGRANCAGLGCDERTACRRFVVRIVWPPSVEWFRRHGDWISADLERIATGTCASFVQYRGST